MRDSLAGRMQTVRLWPLSQSEIRGSRANFVQQLLDGSVPHVVGAPVGRDAFASVVAEGGYPEVRARLPARRTSWFRDYLDAIVERDIKEIATAHKTREIPGLLRVLAAQAANLLEYRKTAVSLELDPKTVKAYIAILENFCGMELLKHADWCGDPPEIYHYRDGRDEVDVTIEDRSGAIACVEVKAAASIVPEDFRVMAKLRDSRPHQFKAGVVLYTGAQTVPLGDRLWAVPISGLWSS